MCIGKPLSRTIWLSFNKERMSHLCDSTVAGPTAGETMYWQANANTPLSVTLLLNVPDVRERNTAGKTSLAQ